MDTEFEYKVGDRVRCVVDAPDGREELTSGCMGTVVGMFKLDDIIVYKVRWDAYIRGHDCNGLCDKGYGWNVYEDEIELADDTPCDIKIEFDASELNSLFS